MGVWSTTELADSGADLDYRVEPMGQKDKTWVKLSDDTIWLFKYVRDSGGWYRGEDWAEWCYYELGKLLEIPVAEVRPATIEGKRGILSRNIAGPNQRLVHGNELLYQAIEGYEKEKGRSNQKYSVDTIHASLETFDVGPGSGAWGSAVTGFDALTAYLVLDALSAAQDRHHGNWAALQGSFGYALAPSFDHGNAFGFQERAEAIQRILREDGGVARWASKGKSPHFLGKPTLVDVAASALRLCSPELRTELKFRLAGDVDVLLSEAIATVPQEIMSQDHKQFVSALFKHNRKRVNDEL